MRKVETKKTPRQKVKKEKLTPSQNPRNAQAQKKKAKVELKKKLLKVRMTRKNKKVSKSCKKVRKSCKKQFPPIKTV